MIKYFTTILFVSIIFTQESGGSLGFMNISPTANSRSLGNTIGSELNSPASLLFSPANIWQYSAIRLSATSQNLGNGFNEDLGISYYNVFGGIKWKKLTIAGGYIDYGVDDIEKYDQYANYQYDFGYASNAKMIGVAYKISSLLIGIGVNQIHEGFDISEPTENYKGDHIGFDFGVTILDLKFDDVGKKEKRKSIFVSTGMCSKTIISGTDKMNSAYSTTSGFTKFSYVQGNFSFSGYADLIFQQSLERYYTNWGTQVLFRNKLTKLYFNTGISNIPIYSMGYDYFSLFKYSKKFSYGLGIEIGPFNFQYSKVLDTYYDSNHITAGFILKSKK